MLDDESFQHDIFKWQARRSGSTITVTGETASGMEFFHSGIALVASMQTEAGDTAAYAQATDGRWWLLR